MSDNKKYYYLKLKENFFDSDSMIILESMQDGYKYSNILLKLYLRSLKQEGKLMFNERIPYNSTILSQVTRHSVGDVEKAVQVFKELGLIEMLDNGAIFITDIQNFIGTSSTEADRIRAYRTRISQEKQALLPEDTNERTNVQQMNDTSTPEKEIEIDKEIEKEKKNIRNSGKPKYADDSPYLELATGLFAYMKKNNEEAKEPNLQSWADDMRKLVELDGRSIENVKEVIRWSQRDDFWKGNILSAKKLREKYDQLKVQASNTKTSRPGERPVLSGKEESYAGIDF